MNRHENVVCRGCGEVDFGGRCYRCLSCINFNMCGDCYDNDFTNPQHPFDHPVKCVFTPADVELYFGGEYLNDPPQSYRCPYCKEWGFNESTFLEHVTAVHVGASTLLVSTMVTLFEQQQAVRLFLEDEQLEVFASAAKSRNELMNRSEGSLDLYLEPLNPNGSYQRDNVPIMPLTIDLSKSCPVEVAPWAVPAPALSVPNSNRSGESNFLILEPVRRRTLLDRARHRFNMDRPPLPLSPLEQQQQQLGQVRQQLQQAQQAPQPLFSMDMMRFNEPLPTSRVSRTTALRALSSPTSPTPGSSSGRTVMPFSENIRRTFYPASELTRTRSQRHRTPRLRMDAFPPSSLRQGHVQRLRGGPGLIPPPSSSDSRVGGAGGVASGSMQRLVELNELANGVDEPMNPQGMPSGTVMLHTIEEEDYQQQQQQAEQAKQLTQQERKRFLCYPFLSTMPHSMYPPEEQITFLLNRAEFVAQLISSVLCEEQLELIVPSIGATTTAEAAAAAAAPPVQPETDPQCPKLQQNRASSEFAGAGDSQLDFKPTT